MLQYVKRANGKGKRGRACFSENICFGHKHRVKGKWPSECYALKTKKEMGTGNKRRKMIKYKEIVHFTHVK